MTSEIVIMNREAVAVAADSAITMNHEGGEKIFTSANKIYTLSKYHPVGIMVFGNANFMGVPWETIIKTYREKLGDKEYNKLKEYAEDFIDFLDNGNRLFKEEIQKSNLLTMIYEYFKIAILENDIFKKIDKIIEEKDHITENEIKDITKRIINEHFNIWDEAKNIETISTDFNEKILKKYEEEIEEAINDVFQDMPLEDETETKLKRIASFIFSKYPQEFKNLNYSGVVFFGFGSKNTFPVMVFYEMECIVEDKLKYQKVDETKTGFKQRAIVYPFAQTEMVNRFMEGIDPQYSKMEEKYLSKIFEEYGNAVVDHLNNKGYDIEDDKLQEKFSKISQTLLKNHIERLEKIRNKNFVNPTTQAVSMLPKDELAEMAESLINLTSLKRKVSMDSETVGGPIDVAVVSKGDGFIWINRKHYFDKELNPYFFEKYYMGE